MMTHPLVAERRAARLAALGLPVLDLCRGLGGDLAAITAAGAAAAGVERDPVHALFAGHNSGARVVRGDVTEMRLDLDATAVVIDSARRHGKRPEAVAGRVLPAAVGYRARTRRAGAGRGDQGATRIPATSCRPAPNSKRCNSAGRCARSASGSARARRRACAAPSSSPKA